MLNRFCLAGLVGALGFALLGCDEPQQIAQLFPTTPLAQLSGVALGMTAEDLHVVRPAAQAGGYRGFVEQLGDIEIAYDFPPNTTNERAVKSGARLQRIMMSENAASTEDAIERWRAQLAAAVSSQGSPIRCERLTGSSPGERALWEIGGLQLEIAVRRPLNTGNQVVPDRVVYSVSRIDSSPQASNAEEIPCRRSDRYQRIMTIPHDPRQRAGSGFPLRTASSTSLIAWMTAAGSNKWIS